MDNKDIYQESSVTYVRREGFKRPSLKRHALQAMCFFFIAIAALIFGYQFLGNENDAIATGVVEIETAPMPAASDNLAGNGTDLPDLLQGEVPQGENPTERLDALGNPIGNPRAGNTEGNSAQSAQGGLAGSLPQSKTIMVPTETVASVQPLPQQPMAQGPRTILIDGKPINGGSFPTAALPRAPLADITRSSPYGPVPTISAGGSKAVTSYARPFTPSAGKSQVAIIIGGLGIDRNLTRRIISEMPPEVTLSFAAHINGLQTWVHQARDRGHEVIVEIPMEGYNFNPAEPGAGRTLKSGVTAANNIRNLDYLLARAQGYFAVTNYNGDRVIDDPTAMTPILQHLSNAGVGFIYDGSGSGGSLASMTASTGTAYNKAYAIIDAQSDVALIQSQLSTLEAASSVSPQIGVGFALPETFMTVKNWVGTLDAKGIELAPASFVLNQ